MTVPVVILAGGEGRRLGGGKPQRRLGGRTLVEHAVRRARSWTDEIAIAVRASHQIADKGVPLLLDPPELAGPLGGLASALRFGREEVLVIPCDAPFLPDDLPMRLAAALPGYGAALAVSGGQVHAACGLWRTAVLAQLPGYAASGRRSLIGFAETIGFARVEWPQEFFLNINRPEDLAAAEARLA